jgi:hypothetical protein
MNPVGWFYIQGKGGNCQESAMASISTAVNAKPRFLLGKGERQNDIINSIDFSSTIVLVRWWDWIAGVSTRISGCDQKKEGCII